MRREVSVGQMVLMEGTETMPAPRKYPLELRERAVAMYHAAEPNPVIRQLARDLGVHPEALRNWIRQDQTGQGERTDRPTTAVKEELAALRKEVVELRRANEILRVASAFFALELDTTRTRF